MIAIVLIVLVAVGGGYYATQQMSSTTSSSMSASSSSAGGMPVPNPDTLVEDTGTSYANLDPATQWGPRENIIMENAYETLLTWDGPTVTKVIPWLAQSMPDVSPDGLTYTFHLRQGILFQDGTPFNASAVKFSIDRAILINSANSPNYMVAYNETMAIKGGPEYAEYSETTNNYNATAAKAYLAAGGVTVIDPYTVSITLEHPYAPALYTFAFTSVMSILSPSYIIAHCAGSTEMAGVVPGTACTYIEDNGAVGTGPFRIVDNTPKVHTILERFDGYWGGPSNTGPAKLKRYIINYVPSVGTRELDLFTGTADAIEIRQVNAFDIIDKTAWLNSSIIKPLKPGIRVWVHPTIAINYIMINPRFPPFDDMRFRQAVAYAFPYDKFISTALNGFATKLNAPIPAGMFGYDPTIQGYTYDPDKARALFQQVNYSGTITLTVQTGDANNLAAALLIKDTLAQLAPTITVNVKELEFTGWEDLWHHQKLPMDVGTWTMDIPDPSDLLPNWVTPGGFVAIDTGFGSNATLTNLCNNAAITLDATQRQAMYSEIQKEILRKSPDIMLVSPLAIFAERDWVLPANDSTGGTFYTGRAINNVESGDGAGGINGGYHAYQVYKAQTTQQVAIDIGGTPPLLISNTWAAPTMTIETRFLRPHNYP